MAALIEVRSCAQRIRVSTVIMRPTYALNFVLLGCLMASDAGAQQPDSLLPNNRVDTVTARVSPSLEIEVLDPNRDARGNPAVTTKVDEYGNTQVEIPPSLIVHRYYYSGDRSFRGPDLPGGPSIVIAQNPRDGQQVYLPVQMLPGSPIVHYSARSIEYDFGNRAVIVSFPHVGEPVVSYRNGRPPIEKAAKMLGVDRLKSAWSGAKEQAAIVKEKSKTAAQATRLTAGNLARPFTLPAQNLVRFFPGGAALTDPGLESRIKEQAALQKQQVDTKQAELDAQLNELDLPRPR